MNVPFSNEWLSELGSRWDGKVEQLIGGSNASFYGMEVNGIECILRITANTHRSAEAVGAELEWMRHLERKGNLLNKPIVDRSGNWLHTKEWQGESYITCVTEKLKGEILGLMGQWSGAAISEWGRVMARFHEGTQDFNAPTFSRSSLNGRLLLKMANDLLPANDPALTVLEQSWTAIAGVPQQADRFGLIHSDLTQGNLRWTDGQISVFDFDDCQYAPFIYDLAVTLSVTLSNLQERADFEVQANYFLMHLLQGYYEIRTLYQEDLRRIQDILNYFNALVYLSFIHKGKIDSHSSQMARVRCGIAEGCFVELNLQERILDLTSSLNNKST